MRCWQHAGAHTATGSWLFDFQTRMRAVWRHDVFRRRVIRQKNGADTLYTLHTSRSSGDQLLTNEELPRVASRRVAPRVATTLAFFALEFIREQTNTTLYLRTRQGGHHQWQ